MKARLVEDKQNFERGLSKKTLGLGGIVLEKERRIKQKALKQAQIDAEIFANKEWESYLQKTLVGKKITANMTSLPTMNINTHQMSGTRETRDFTITVQDISTRALDDLLINIVLADTENNMYSLSLEEKIYFD